MPFLPPVHAAPVLAAAAVLGLPAAAPAASFGAPQPTNLPALGQTAVALGDDGGVAVAVRSSEGSGDAFRLRLEVAAGTLAGGLERPQTLATAPGGAIRELQAARPAGGALVAWAQVGAGPGGAERLRYAARPEGASRFAPARTLAPVASATGSQLRLAAGPDGTALAVWRDRGRLLSATAREGRFGAPRLLTGEGSFPSVASAGPGRWVVAWTRGAQRRRTGLVAVLDGRRTVRRALGPVLASAFVPGVRVAAAPDGTAFVTGLRRVGRERYRGRAFLRQVAPTLGPAEPIGTGRRTRLPSVAAGPGGGAVAAFLGIPQGGRFAALLGAVRPAGGPLGPVGILSREEVYDSPRATWTADGPLVGWIAGRRAPRFVVRVTAPTGTERTPATTLGEAGRPEGLQLAGSRAGAVAVWPGTEGGLVIAAAPAG